MDEIESLYGTAMLFIAKADIEREQDLIYLTNLFNTSQSVFYMQCILNKCICDYRHLVRTFQIHSNNPLIPTSLWQIRKRLIFLMNHRCYKI